MRTIAPNVFEINYPLTVCGAQFGRRVSLLPLQSGGTFVHSSAPFSQDELAAINKLGAPEILFEPTPIHDTHTRTGCQLLSEAKVVAPVSLHRHTGRTNVYTPESTQDELSESGIELYGLDGLAFGEEWVVYYRPAKTLIVADLFFNFPEDVSGWTRQFLKLATGRPEGISMSRLFRALIRDKKAFQASLAPILSLEIQHLVPGHGTPVTSSTEELKSILERHKLF